MGYLRIASIVLGILLFASQVWSYTSIDEFSLQQNASGGVPARFIQVDEATLDNLKDELKELESSPDYVLADPSPRSFGRNNQPFLPDSSRR